MKQHHLKITLGYIFAVTIVALASTIVFNLQIQDSYLHAIPLVLLLLLFISPIAVFTHVFTLLWLPFGFSSLVSTAVLVTTSLSAMVAYTFDYSESLTMVGIMSLVGFFAGSVMYVFTRMHIES